MKIEALTVAVRPRKAMEAVDLGIHMVAAWAWSVFVPLLFVLVPCWVALLFIFPNSPWLVILFLWWFKPFWDRIPLFVLSRAMFGTPPRLSETLRAWPSLLRFPWFGAMTLFRLSPNRALTLPVVMLEGLSGERRRRRKNLIATNLVGMGLLVNAVFMVFEWLVLFFGFFILSTLLVPEELGHNLFSEPYSRLESILFSAFYWMSVWLLEPFFVGACFSLYLNCRTKLEGWHLELAFRRLAQRLREEMGRAAILALACLLLGMVPARAQEDDIARAKTQIDEVLKDPVFGKAELKRGWYLKKFNENQKKNEQEEPLVWGALASMFAGLVRLLIWALGAVVVIFIVYIIVKLCFGAKFKSKPPPAEPERKLVLFGQEIDPLSLPEDIPSTASRLFAAGDVRAAMSLLFRGALIELARTGKLEVADFVTEEECLRLAARKLKGDDIGFLTDLTRTWQRVAYGHRMPARDRFDQLCVQWRRLLGGVT